MLKKIVTLVALLALATGVGNVVKRAIRATAEV